MLKFFKKKDKNKKPDTDKDVVDTDQSGDNLSNNNPTEHPKSDSLAENTQTSHQQTLKEATSELSKSELAQNIDARKEIVKATTLKHEGTENKISKEANLAQEKHQQASENHEKIISPDNSDMFQAPLDDTNKEPQTDTIKPSNQDQKPQIKTTVVAPRVIQQVETNTPSDKKLDEKLEKSRNGFGKKMKNLFSLKKAIDEDLFEDIETTLLMADVGAKATVEIVDNTAKSVKRLKLSDNEAVYDALKIQLTELAEKVEKPLVIDTKKSPYVILVVGVNGVGKTTTIAKMARRFKRQGKSVMLAAGDTFRAAAVDQLKTWGAREGIPVIAQTTGSDSASVIFDAMSSAKAKGMDILIADTAGRLHTQANLMQELSKIGRVMKKNDDTAPHETLIVVDGGTGQNAISQIQEFNKTTKLTGIAITKLDGTAKGGVLFNLAKEFGIPVRFIGVGEGSSDLKPFVAKEFVDALLE